MTPGKNIAIKIPFYCWKETVEFYRDRAGPKVNRELDDSTGFEFGSLTLWIDRVPHQNQTDIWLELLTMIQMRPLSSSAAHSAPNWSRSQM